MRDELERKKPEVKYTFTFGEFTAEDFAEKVDLSDKDVYLRISIRNEESDCQIFKGEVETEEGKLKRINFLDSWKTNTGLKIGLKYTCDVRLFYENNG